MNIFDILWFSQYLMEIMPEYVFIKPLWLQVLDKLCSHVILTLFMAESAKIYIIISKHKFLPKITY